MHYSATLVIVLIADRYENNSRFHTFREVIKNLSALQEMSQWSFSYLGPPLTLPM